MARTTIEHPPIAWRLEAFDLRAGLAFATCREQQTETQMARDWPCLFFAPPDFAAEPVDNIAAALSATRGCFDSELLVNDREASFETPDDVADFVRRAYVSSASGDGSDGPGGTGPLPPSPEGPREASQIGNEPSAAAAELLGAIKNFSLQTKTLGDGQSFNWKWEIATKSSIVESLASGAIRLMVEMLERLPQNGDIKAECQWLDDARTLGGAITNLGLWDAVLSMHGFLLRGKPYPSRWVMLDQLPDSVLAFALFVSPVMPDEIDLYWRWLHADHARSWALPVHGSAGDPFECFSRWPVPRFAFDMVPTDMHEKASVEHLLAAFLGSPSIILKLGSAARSAIDVVLFACAHLVNWRQHSLSTQGLYPPMALHPSSMAVAAIEQRGHAGVKWILDQLPSRGFSVGYEELIERARDIRYRDKSGGLVPLSKPAAGQ